MSSSMRRRRTSAVDGVSYQGVPLTRHRDAIIRARTGRRLPDAPPQHEAAPADATKWGVERALFAPRPDDVRAGLAAAGTLQPWWPPPGRLV